ncbi:IS66 family insertion sequence element accessory protein TnpA [Jeotgalibaca porci]|uniref:IS66 family insertion sequence element accessory protein TnpA n=1 Tax=Jeotgalibaca porci TaxID=1868793 RepID=UPI00359F2CA9
MKYTQDQWVEIIDGYASSKLTLQDYCRGYKIAVSTYYKHKKLQSQSSFLPVVFEKQKNIYFSCNGFQIEVEADIDPSSLATIMKAARYD